MAFALPLSLNSWSCKYLTGLLQLDRLELPLAPAKIVVDLCHTNTDVAKQHAQLVLLHLRAYDKHVCFVA